MAEPSAFPAGPTVTRPAASPAPLPDAWPAARATVIEVRPAVGPASTVTAPDGTAPVVILACVLLCLCGLAAWLLAHQAQHRARHPEGSRSPVGRAPDPGRVRTRVPPGGRAPAGAP